MRAAKFDQPVGEQEELIKALRTLPPGQRLVYHRGFLKNASVESSAVAAEAYRLFLEGKVHLFSRRLDKPLRAGEVDFVNGLSKQGYEYIAIGKSPAK